MNCSSVLAAKYTNAPIILFEVNQKNHEYLLFGGIQILTLDDENFECFYEEIKNHSLITCLINGHNQIIANALERTCLSEEVSDKFLERIEQANLTFVDKKPVEQISINNSHGHDNDIFIGNEKDLLEIYRNI